jgi:hypothetical protein
MFFGAAPRFRRSLRKSFSVFQATILSAAPCTLLLCAPLTIASGILPPAAQTGTQKITTAVSVAPNSGTPGNVPLPPTVPHTFDGPAELPRTYLQTRLADTPAPGSTIHVGSGGDLQGALDRAQCGDTLELEAGATFTGPQFKLPAKACDDQHWIILRTSAPDSSLPPEGTRMTPCYSGVASLRGRPAFSCAVPQHLLATILHAGAGSGPIIFANGANHYRLVGLEITRATNDGKPVVALISPELGGSMNQIVLDRLYIHGTPEDETRRGVELSGSTSVAIQDSYISELHCSVQGSCTDSQAVAGGIGFLPMGPFKIVDNFLEAAGENIIFGGGRATQTPSDIEIRLNHLFKPMFWMPGQPGFVGPAFIVKNHFELKNAQRVLFDSNVLEDTWGGFSQAGYSVGITPKNQTINDESVCPICQVTDVTVRYVTISHVGGGFCIADVLSSSGGAPRDGQRYSIHDVIADDIDRIKYSGHGTFAQIATIAHPLLQNLKIDHITAFPLHTLFNVGGPDSVKMTDFTFTNSIVTSGEYPIWSTGAFGTDDCAFYAIPLRIMQRCFAGYVFSSNAIVGAPAEYQRSAWPSGNFFYDSPAAIGFVDFNNGNGGDYHLLPSSPAKGKASDGSDLGANVDAVYSAIRSVR